MRTAVVESSSTPSSWTAYPSLSEVIVAAERSLAQPQGSQSAKAWFLTLQERYSGHAVRFGRLSRKEEAALVRVDRFCAANGVAVELFLTAQFWSLHEWLKAKNHRRVLATMMCGPHATRRYNTYLTRTQKRYHGVVSNAWGNETAIGKLKGELLDAECKFGRAIVDSYRDGVPVAEAVASEWEWLAMNDTWRAVALGEPLATLHELLLTYDQGVLQQVLHWARLRAAAVIADEIRLGLSDRIGFSAFTWESFGELLHSSFPRAAKAAGGPLSLPGVSGFLWD